MNRRLALSALLAPIAASAARGHFSSSHWSQGGWGVPRIRVGCLANTAIAGVPAIALPSHSMYAIPTSSDAMNAGAFFAESGDVVAVGGCLVVQTPGRYRITASVDWPAKNGAGDGIRRVSIYRVPVGVAPPVYTPYAMSMVPDGNDFDRLAGQDWAARSADAWGTLTAPDEDLLAGEAIFMTCRSDAVSDWIQCCQLTGTGILIGSAMTYLQMELLTNETGEPMRCIQETCK